MCSLYPISVVSRLRMLTLTTRAVFARFALSTSGGNPNHTFRFRKDLITEIVVRMKRLPGWKQAQFHERYFEVDAEFLSGALTLKAFDPGLAVYQKSVFEDERKVEATLRELASRPEIDLRRPVTASDWSAWMFKTESSLAEKGGEDYLKATNEQIDVCQRLFRFPLSVVTGPAGTGKTTVIEALVRGLCDVPREKARTSLCWRLPAKPQTGRGRCSTRRPCLESRL